MEPIYEKDLRQYKSDSQRSLKNYWFRKHPIAKILQEAFTIRCLLAAAASLFVAKVYV